ncbi:MAG: hypothetical protein HY775_10900 [Acidobacteria bacterium]|nr:hypothetical protein [Acidobacteriota bacterium]
MRLFRALVGVIVLVLGVPAAGPADPPGQVLAGAAVVDSTWHVGASSGQYAGDPVLEPGSIGPYDPQTPERGVEPHQHSLTSRPSYGLQGRESVRALVIQGSDGKRVGLVSNNLYIPQDLIDRRVAGLLAEHDALVDLGLAPGPRTGITGSNLVVSVSHSHSSPYYSTPSWGPWTFQDVFDIRFFEFYAERMAEAVIRASASMVPAKVGGSVSYFDLLQRHSFGPEVADDGTPAGFPEADFPENRSVGKTENEKAVFVIAVDAAATGEPLATWVVLGLHPEMLSGNDLLASEYVNTMFRFVDREVGGVTLFSQEDTGTAEPAKDGKSQPSAVRAEYSHREYAQVERAGRLLADAVKKTRGDIESGTPEDSEQFSAMSGDFPVGVADLRLAPPNLRPSPTVSNCRAEKAFDGNPGVPLVGLPDCVFPAEELGLPGPPVSPRVGYGALREAGVPVPENYGFPSFVSLQESDQVHLQAIRLGNIAVTTCPCEQWGDQARNIRSRLNKVPGDLWDGFDWTEHARGEAAGTPWCRQNSDTTWTCADPRAWDWDLSGPVPRQVWDRDLPPVSDLAYRRMKAQIHNDAAGWDDLANLQAETDPVDPAKIKGNFTHEELTDFAYDLVVPIGMTNDYWGYIVTYREWERGDHYRKALSGLGPHSADFMATRLSRMAANLNGANLSTVNPKDVVYGPEDGREYATAQAIGEAARAYIPAYEATLPADGGAAGIERQPGDIARFDAASVRWTGGDPYTDTPNVRVERLEDGAWVPFADGSGEVQYRTWFPQPEDLPAWRAGEFAWHWEATFEALASDLELVDARGSEYRATPEGTYRFVIDGTRRGLAGATSPYHLESNSFDVSPWDGITVEDIRVDPGDGTVSFALGPVNHYTYGTPNTYTVGPIDYPDTATALDIYPFISPRDQSRNLGPGGEQFCFACSFRPWADTGRAVSAIVTIERAGGGTDLAEATLGPDGRWHTIATLGEGDRAFVAAGGVLDEFGQVNGAASASVG